MSKGDVCLISESAESAKEIEAYLKQIGSFFVRRHHMTKIDFTDPEASQVIIFDSLTAMTQTHFHCLWRVAKQFTTKPTLVIAREIPISIYRHLCLLRNTAALQKPCDPKLFGEYLTKLQTGEELKPTRYPRFNTDQPIRIMVMRTGLYLPSRMKNYSVGGAFVEYRGISLRIGDQLQVSFEDAEAGRPQKSSIMPAKVMWIRTRENAAEHGPGVGVQFLQPLVSSEPPTAVAL